MLCTRDNVGKLGLDEIVDASSAIYARHDAKRSLWDIWSHAMHHAAAVAEEIRKIDLAPGAIAKLRQEIADLTLWFFTMLGKLRGQLGLPNESQSPQDWLVRISVGASELMWNRYPGVCPGCYCAMHADADAQIKKEDLWQPCSCDWLAISAKEKKKTEIRARAKRTRRLARAGLTERPRSLDEWQMRVASLYDDRLRKLSKTEVMLHLLEEMGEVSDSLIRMYSYSEKDRDHLDEEIIARQIRLEDELADVLSWLFSLVNHSSERREEKWFISTVLWDRYGSDTTQSFWCGTCNQAPCACTILLLQSEDQIREIRNKLAGARRVDLK